MEPDNVLQQALPRVGITIGDFNGIGPEVVMKVLADNRINRICIPVIYGSARIISRYKKLLNIENFSYFQVNEKRYLNDKRVNVVNCWEENHEITPGQVTPEAGQCAFLALEQATADLKEGFIDAVVTAPINKHNIQSDAFRFAGHTEYYASHFGNNKSLMLLVSEKLRIGTVTGHISLQEVPQVLTRALISEKLQLLLNSLVTDFNIQKPRIAVLGLNPHAGEEGLLGNEDSSVISPVVEQFRKQGHLVFGPFPADGFFGSMLFKQYDGVLAMYHDQGLIPFKMLSFEDGVNFTAGLSIVRTSPDHGTAYDIAGQNIADESSMRAAVFAACDIFRNRQAAAEVAANAMPRKQLPSFQGEDE